MKLLDDPLGALDILRVCSVPGFPRVFALPTQERPSRVVSQQRRALNLTHSLFDGGLLSDRGLCVVGAGFGGLTCAAYAALQGVRVQVLEKCSSPLERFSNSRRYLHPRLYDWPYEGWDSTDAALPVLNWCADEARAVVQSLKRQFDVITESLDAQVAYKIDPSTLCLEGGNEGVTVVWRGADGELSRGYYDAAILSLGFGPERSPVTALPGECEQYWDLTIPGDPLPDLSSDSITSIGNGDGALADLVGLAALLAGEPKRVFQGDFSPLLRQLEDVRQDVLNLESDVKSKLAGGAAIDPDLYENELRTLLATASEFPSAAIGGLEVLHRGAHVIDVRGTYAANRALFVAYYPRSLIRKAERRQPSGQTSRIGPFISTHRKNWTLFRQGPDNVLRQALPEIASKLDSARWRNRLELTERPITSSPWPSAAGWSIPKFPSDRPLPRLLFTSEWWDTYVQRILRERHPDAATRFYRGILRLQLLLMDELRLTDAHLVDGSLLPNALAGLSAVERAACVVYARGKDLFRAALDFVSTVQDDGSRLFKEMEFSSLGGYVADPLSFETATSDRETLEQITEQLPQFSTVFRNATTADDLMRERVRLIPSGAVLKSITPHFGLLEELADETIEVEPVFPMRVGSAATSRAAVFSYLRDITGVENLLTATSPTWVPKVVSWYNAAYNATIFRKNGCTAFELFWFRPLGPGESVDATAVRLSLAEIASHDDESWAAISAALAVGLARWRRGEVPLTDAIGGLPNARIVQHCPVRGMDRSINHRLDQALFADAIYILELQSRVLDRNAPQRVLITQAEDALLSATLID